MSSPDGGTALCFVSVLSPFCLRFNLAVERTNRLQRDSGAASRPDSSLCAFGKVFHFIFGTSANQLDQRVRAFKPKRFRVRPYLFRVAHRCQAKIFLGLTFRGSIASDRCSLGVCGIKMGRIFFFPDFVSFQRKIIVVLIFIWGSVKTDGADTRVLAAAVYSHSK